MKKLKWIYQYISLNQDVHKILQTLRKCPRACIIPVLDIEDSLQIPLDIEKTTLLKARARLTLKTVLNMVREQDLDLSISIRINASDTAEFRNDIEMLEEVSPLITWGSIFLPKVHSAEALNEYIQALKGIKYHELVVMAESKAFFNHYADILPLCKASIISKIHFGHWDYFFDAREFPVPLPDDRRLWDQIELLLRIMEPENMHYIHTPYCFLLKHADFQSIAAYLNVLSGLPFGLTTLSFSQAQAVCKTGDNILPIKPVTYSYDTETRIKIADDLVSFFNRPISPEYSFNIDTSIYRFYAPHEYLNALEFLNRQPNG